MADEAEEEGGISRRTGASEMFFNKAKLAAKDLVAQANRERARSLAAWHEIAQRTIANAHATAVEKLAQDVVKIYARVYSGPTANEGMWVEFDPDGKTVGTYADFGYDAHFDEGRQRVYHSRVYERGPMRRVGWELWSAAKDGSAPQRHGTREIRDYLDGALALDEAEDAIFWIGGDGVIQRSSLTGDSTVLILDSRSDGWGGPSCIALDRTRQKIFWCSQRKLGVVGYDGSEARTLFTEGQPETHSVTSLEVDSDNGRLYWNCSGQIHQTNLDGTDLVSARWPVTDWGNISLCTSNHLVHCMSSWQSTGAIREFGLYRGILSPDSASGLPTFQMFQKPGFAVTCYVVRKLIVVSRTDETAQQLAFQANRLRHARVSAPVEIGKAHRDAMDVHSKAQADLAEAHDAAAALIATEQQKAAAARDSRQSAAQDRQAAAAAHIAAAKTAADEKRQVGAEQAQQILAPKQQEAATLIQSAQAKLRDARQQLQSS